VKRIRKSRAARILSWVMTVALIAPLLTGMVVPRAARAQQAAPAAATGNTQTVMVVNFENKSGFGGDFLARFVRDAVATELSASNRFDVLPEADVSREASAQNLRPPYDQVSLAKIANVLGATSVVTGEIAFVKIDSKASPKRVSVGLKVRVIEPGSGDVVNGAAQIGEVAKPGVTDNDLLVQEAARNAAYQSVRQILAYNLTEGTVLNIVGTEPNVTVLVNRGSRDGVRPGLEMIVTRGRQRVGKIKITEVYPTDSEAKVVENTLGIRPEDHTRAIFPEVGFTAAGAVAGPKKGTNNAGSTIAKVLLVLALGILIAEISHSGSTTTGVTAESDIQNGAPAIRIVWRDNLFGQGGVQEYHVWRSPDDPFNFTGTPVAAPTIHQYVDLPAPSSFWDGTRSFLQVPFNTGGQQQGGQTASSVTPAASAVVGFTTGRTITYQISAIIRRQFLPPATGNQQGNQNQIEDIESTPVSSGPVTPINQPLLAAPQDQVANVDIRSVLFQWQSRAGADEFVVEVSTDRTFTNRSLIQQFGRFFSTAPNADGVVQTVPTPINLTTSAALRRDPAFLAFVTGAPGAATPTLFWRVGGRNSQDKPGPVHFITRDPHDGDRTFRFIYATPRSFTPAILPPPPP
jgi:hypothetical protein